MNIQAPITCLLVFQINTAIVVAYGFLRSEKRYLGYGYDDDDDVVSNNASQYYDDVASNTTGSHGLKDYTISHMQANYQSVPSEWTAEQWWFFAALMFVFGSISSCFCILIIMPCCCPSAMRTAYARYISPSSDDNFRGDSKKVRLIRK